ncbi:MAG TPA: polysaccharide biosynthesis tyrosine autokinase [Thermomicrobiales bacterium]|nr:polysaccharide biosynthesis tyrosine autokinase [Thermomicrobiales bacterium]
MDHQSTSQRNVYTLFLRRWSWLLAIGMVIALVATNYALSQRVTLYRSTATVQVGRATELRNVDQNMLAITDRLMPTYVELAKRDPVLVAAARNLDLPLSAADLRARLLVTRVPGTQLIDITAIDADPLTAAAIADEVARQLVLQSPAPAATTESQQFVQQQLADLQRKILDAQQETVEVQQRIDGMTSAADIFDAQQELETLRIKIDTWQNAYITLLGSTEPSTTNVLQIANLATSAIPISSSTMLYYAFGVVIGLGLSSLLALGISLLNNRIVRPEDVAGAELTLPVVTVPRYRHHTREKPVTLTSPMARATSSYRELRNVLQIHGLADPRTSLAVTSSYRGEGKTTTAANLAISMAHSGRSVILVDSNFHNPDIHILFDLNAGPGLADIMTGMRSLDDVLQSTPIDHLKVLSVGNLPEMYADVISPLGIRKAFAEIKRRAEIVIVDTPAILQEQEAVLIAKELDHVLLLVESGRVRSSQLHETLWMLEQSDVRVIGLALNKASLSPLPLDWIRRSAVPRNSSTDSRRGHDRTTVRSTAMMPTVMRSSDQEDARDHANLAAHSDRS